MNTETINRGIWGAALSNDRKGIQVRINIYRDKWDEYIKEEITKTFTKEAQEKLLPLVTTEVNMLKKITDETSMVYKSPAKRTVEANDDKADERWSEIEQESHINIFWKQVNAYTRLCNNVLIKVVSRDRKIEFDLYTPDSFMIITDENDWKKILAICIETGERTPKAGNAIENPYSGMQTQIWAKYDVETRWGKVAAGKIAYTKDGKIIKTDDNPYKDPVTKTEPLLPFVLTHKTFPIDGLMNLSEGDGVAHATIHVGLLHTLHTEILKFQSFNQPYMIAPAGTKLPQGQQIGPWSMLTMQVGDGKSGQFGTLQLETDPRNYLEAIQNRISFIYSQNGIPPSAYQLSKSPQSGYAMKIERRALEEIRENDVEFYRDFEKQVFVITRVVNNFHNSKKISENSTFKIDFAESRYDYTIDEIIKEETHELANNLTNEAKLLVKRNPDLSEEEAQEEIEENRRLNANVAPIPEFGSPAGGEITAPPEDTTIADNEIPPAGNEIDE